jgi:polyhydroxyalkanoate synthesis regulator phasin
MVKKIGITCIALIFALVILSGRTVAQSSSALESRISRLEVDNYQLRSQINRLESQLAELSGRASSPTPSPNRPTLPVPRSPNRQVLSSDPMFNRLATLVIELKERVQALEAQVAQLKKQRR